MSKRILSTILMLIMILNSTVGLAEFTLPASLVELEAEAFDGNTSLTGAVTLPAGITAIGNSAFRGSNLFALRLPEDAAGMDALGLAEDQAIAYLYLEGAETAVADASGARYVFGPSDSAMNTHPAFISSDALVENDRFYYGIQDEKATLLCAVEDLAVPSVVTIPAEVEGYPVAAIGPHAFWQLEQVETIILTCEAVEDETAFVDVPDAEIIRVVQGELTLLPVSSDAQAPFTTGDTVTWTVNAVGGSAPYKYRFAIYFGSTCLEQTSYTTEPAYSYTFLDAGEYNLVVTVRDSNMDSVSLTTDSFVVKNAGADIEITEITPSVASAKVQESVVWTATADKGIGAYRYAFELKNESGERVAYRSYEASNTFTTVIELPGLYSMKVSVLDENNNGNSLVYEGFEVTVDELTIGSIAVDPETPVTGKDITWTVLANGGLQPYSYSFSVGEDSETNESGVFTYAFTDPGDYTLKISVTDANGSVATEEVPVTVQLHPLEITAITVAPEKAQTEDEVVWTVEAIGGSGGYTYAFILLLDGEELDASSYQSENTFAYTLQTAGAYSIQAFVRDGENTTAKMTSDVLNVTLKPLKALDAEMAEPVVEIGMPASIVAKAEGGQKPLRYSFEIYSGEELVKATAYALDDTLSYTADAAGEYAIKLFVRDSAGTVSEVNGSTKLTVYDHLALHGVAAAADTAAVGDRITWTADVVGGKLPLSCNWKILCNGEAAYEVSTESTTIDYAPLTAGEYTVALSVTDAAGTTFEITEGAVTVAEHETVTDASAFTVSNGTITAYTGTDTMVVVPQTIGDVTITGIGANAFKGNKTIESIILPSTVKTVGANAFQNCTALLSADLSGVKTISSSAFAGCTALKTISITKILMEIGSSAFNGCKSLTALNFPELEEGDDPLDYGLNKIGEAAFANCSGIKAVHLANTVTTVGNRAFENCVALSGVNYPRSLVSDYGYMTGIFQGCVRLTYIEVPEGITALAIGFFSNAPALKEVKLPSTLVQIDNGNGWDIGAFSGCVALESVNLPYGLKSIGNHAFRGCTALGWTYVPSTVTSIGRSAFEGFGENLTIESEYGAYAIDYAIENDIPYYYLSLTGHQRPSGTLYLGYPFNLYGYVRGSVNVASVTATLYDGSGTVLQSVTVEPGETDYSLAGTINRTFDFASMALGEYKFSLTGSTALTTEQFYMCDFRIIKEPVSVKTDGFAGPGMYMVLEESKPVTGTIQCNYPITAVELAFNYDVVNDDGEITSSGTAKYSDASTGNQKSYDLSKLNASYYTAQNSEVHMKITVVADGQTRVLFEADYIVTDNVSPSGMILDMAKLEAFVNDKANRNFFDYYSSYARRVVEKYATSEKDKAVLNMYLYQQDGYKEGAFVALLDEIFTGADVGHNEYYVNHYKDEIISFINSVGAEWLDSVGYDEALSYDVQKTIAAYPTLKGDIAKELSNLGVSKQSQQFMSMLIKNIEPLEPLLDCLDAAGEIEEFSELLFHVAMDYTCGQNVLDYLENSYEGADEQHAYYQEAIDELRELYVGDYCARIDKIFDYLQKEAVSMAIKKGEKTIKQIFNTAAEDILGVTFGGEVKLILGIAKILWKTYTDKTGFYQGAEEYTQFMTIYTTYANALYSYQEHFDVVNDGSYTDEELQKLMTSFNVTRLAGIRVMRYLRTIEHIEGNDDYAILQEVRKLGDYKDYFYIAE